MLRGAWASWLTAGAALIAVGLGWDWYYAAVVYPQWLSDFWSQCAANRVPCPMPGDYSFQPLFQLGELVTVIGIALVGVALLQRHQLTQRRPRPPLDL